MKQILLYTVLGVLCIFLSCLAINYDYDFFARLIVGEQFIEHGILPYKDFLSYTPTHPWYDHEWGSGVVFYFVLKYFGSAGILFLHAILMFGVAFFVIKIQRLQRHSYPVSLVFMSIFLILFAHLNPNLIRCQMFSFFFFSMFLFLLEHYRKYNSKLIWLIPPLVVVWNNLHGGVVSGLGILFIYLVVSIFKKKNWQQLLYVFCISLPLLVINPYGIKYLAFLFSATTKNRKYIVEWWPFFAARHWLYYLLPSLYGIYASFVSIKKQLKLKKYDVVKILLLTITLFEGLAHVKLLSLTIITAAALCYKEMSHAFLKYKTMLKHVEKSLYAVIIMLGLSVPLFSPTYPRADLYKFPLYEVEFLKINNIKGNIVVPFGFGSYVSYKLYPNNHIYMDGRYEEVYNDKEYEALRNYELAEQNWRDIYTKYDTDILMPKKTVDIYEVLKKDKEWVHLFDGRQCGIFVKRDNVKKSYIEPKYNLEYYKQSMFEGFFGNNLRRKVNDQ